jgi:arginyl-tRNA--protein-N-Asp/Glu arginylyltransferase
MHYHLTFRSPQRSSSSLPLYALYLLALSSLLLLSSLPLTSQTSCPSGVFPKIFGTATINDCFTEIKQVDVDEKNDRLVAVGLSDIVGRTEKANNKKPIILMMKLTKDGSNS